MARPSGLMGQCSAAQPSVLFTYSGSPSIQSPLISPHQSSTTRILKVWKMNYPWIWVTTVWPGCHKVYNITAISCRAECQKVCYIDARMRHNISGRAGSQKVKTIRHNVPGRTDLKMVLPCTVQKLCILLRVAFSPKMKLAHPAKALHT